MSEKATYRIVRRYFDPNHPDDRKVIEPGLTLEEVKDHCNDPDTKEDGVWFDSFEEE